MATLGVIDQIVAEPLGAAHRDPEKAIDNLGEALEEQLRGLNDLSGVELVNQRQEKYLAIGDKGLA